MVISKSKGSDGERKVYKLLRNSNIFLNLKRCLGSGSSDEIGDIQFTYLDKQFYVEVKNKKAISEIDLDKFFEKQKIECGINGIPLLIYKTNYSLWYVICIFHKIRCRMKLLDFIENFLVINNGLII